MDKFKLSEFEYLYKTILNISQINLSADKTAMEITSFYDSLFEKSENKKVSGETADKELVYIKLMVLRYYIFSLSIPRTVNTDLFLLASLFTHVDNTIVAIVKLTEQGLDYQAFSLMRNLTELYMLLLTVIESPQKREEYEKAVDAKTAREVWHRFFNKTHFIQTLDKYSGINSEAKNAYKCWVDDVYSELSSYAHNDYANLICYSFAVGEKELNPLNLLGEYVSRKKIVYSFLVKIIAPAEMLLSQMLEDDNIDININDLFVDAESWQALTTIELQNIISRICKYILMDCIRDNTISSRGKNDRSSSSPDMGQR